jgi:nicotinamide-nucleotide adenylyltransferase
MVRALYIGRFQPYHNGHKYVIDQITRESDELIIGIGSAQISHEPDHPFTAGERVLMLSRALKNVGCPLYIIPLEDINRNALWVAHIISMIPPFDRIYSGNPLVIRLFHEAGYPVITPALYEREQLSGTTIRKRILCGKPWKDLVPYSVIEVMEEIDGISRIMDLNRNDMECR